MPVCLYIFLLVFQFACENFFPTAFLFHFFVILPLLSPPLHCVDVTLLSSLLPIHRSLYPSSCSSPFFFVLLPFPLSIPSSPLFSFSPPLPPFLCSFSLFLPHVLPFPLLFSPFSSPYPSTTSFFFSLSLPPALSSFLPFCPRLSVTLYLCISVSLSVHAPYFPVSFCRMSFVPFLLLLPSVFSPCFPASSYLPSFVSLASESTQSSVVRCPIIVACHMHRLYL